MINILNKIEAFSFLLDQSRAYIIVLGAALVIFGLAVLERISEGVLVSHVYPAAVTLSTIFLAILTYKQYRLERTDIKFSARFIPVESEYFTSRPNLLQHIAYNADYVNVGYVLVVQIDNGGRHPIRITSLQSDNGFSHPLLHEGTDGSLGFPPKIPGGDVFEGIVPVADDKTGVLAESGAIRLVDLAGKKYYLKKAALQELKTRIKYLITHRLHLDDPQQ